MSESAVVPELISTRDSVAVRDAALRMPLEDRAALFCDLLDSLEGLPEEESVTSELSKEWMDVIQRRLEEVKSGKVQLIDGEDVMRRARQRVGL